MTDTKTCLEEFTLALQAEQRAPSTIRWYIQNVNRLSEYLAPNGHVEGITTHDIRRFLVYLQTEARPWVHHAFCSSPDRRLSGTTVHDIYRALRAFFNFLEREQIIKESPMRQIRPPKMPRPVVKALTEDQMKKLVEGSKERSPFRVRNYALILLMLDTGLRASEVLGLKMCDLDIRTGRAKVMGKGWKERVVPVGFRARQALLKYINRYRREPASIAVEEVFLTERGEAMTYNALKMVFRRLSRRTSIKVHPHMLRHTFATVYLRNGGDIFTLQRILGHSSLEMVRRYAATLFEDMERVHRTASPVDRMKL